MVEDAYKEIEKTKAKVEQEFMTVKKERTTRFYTAFNKVKSIIGKTYQELTRTSEHTVGGKASLELLGDDHLFDYKDSGVQYSVQPHGKRYRDNAQLSGGEKSVAALALLFAIQECNPSPFFIMDEVDAALDSTNVHLISNFVRKRSMASGPNGDGADGRLQCIAISLKNTFYEKASGIIGIYKPASDSVSRV